MNSGVISSRYARTLLKLTRETGRGEAVCAQADAILKNPDSLQSMALEEDLGKFVALMARNSRLEFVRPALSTFVRLYRREAGIRLVRLASAVPSAALEERIRSLIEEKTGCRVLLETRVDPALEGGFVLEIDDARLDASVRGQLERIRRAFVTSNSITL